MMKRIGLLIVVICIVILTGCNKAKPGNVDTGVGTSVPFSPEDSKEPKIESADSKETIAVPGLPSDSERLEVEDIGMKLDSEASIREYLVGQWISDKETLSDYLFTQSDINCNMNIDGDLNVYLSFYNRYTNESKGDYEGKIILDRFYASPDEAPDIITFDLGESDWPGGDYFFLHRTTYDEKSVMSLFFAANGNGIFDLLADIDNFEYAPEEIILEKEGGEISQLLPNKTKEFYASFWGYGEGESLWLDEVKWTPIEEYDPDAPYPTRMTIYEDDKPESILYGVARSKATDILGNPMYPGEVYYVKTDMSGNIIEFEDAEHKAYIEEINKP